MPKSYTIRDATDKELERIKEFQDNCPDFGFHNLSDDYDGWGADTLAERRKVLFDYIDEFSDTKFYEDIAYTRGWADHTGLSITTITRRAQPLVEYVLADDGWLGKGETSDCWQGLDAGKDFKFLYVGLIRLLCSVRGIQDEAAHIAGWFMDYDPKQTGFFGINGCDGDNKCHTVPNPVGPKQPDGYRVAPTKKVVEIKQVEITQDSIIHHMKTNMSNEDRIELVRQLMSEFDIKEQKEVEQKEVEKPTDYKALYEAEVKRREKAETRWNKQMKVSRDNKEARKQLEERIKQLEERLEL
jgi:hypothetical protein